MSYSESGRQVHDHVIWSRELLGVLEGLTHLPWEEHMSMSLVCIQLGRKTIPPDSFNISEQYRSKTMDILLGLTKQSTKKKWKSPCLLVLHYYFHVALAPGTEACYSYLSSLVFLPCLTQPTPSITKAPLLLWAWNPTHDSLRPPYPILYPKPLSPHCSSHPASPRKKRSPGSQANAPAWRALSHHALWGLMFILN